ncbi:MAG: anti-sigma factor antagonist [Geobacteraceae bacterium]|nr:anti-sigma factor antagonist [Geobacteraceae bacterium]
MVIYVKGSAAYLQGDLTYSGMTHSGIDSMAACLRLIKSGGGNNMSIDCAQVRAVDANGLQLLGVWMECARLNGVEPLLINMPGNLQQALQKKGAVQDCTT